MKSPLAKLAVAAAIGIACVMGLFMWTGTQSSVALADVLTRLQRVSVYMYQMSISTTLSSDDDSPSEHKAQATALMSRDLGMKMTMETDMKTPDASGMTRMVQEMYMLPHEGKMITIMPGQKKYMEIEFDEEGFEKQQMENNDPRAMVEQILNCDYISLGRSEIDGIEVEGFQTVDPNYLGGVMGGIDVKIWIDVKTQLPIRSEMDMQMADEMHMHAVIHDFQWNVSVDASEFEPVIPEDYTAFAGGPLKMPTADEESAIEGLRLFTELAGRYPKKLDVMSLSSEIGEFTGRLLTKARPSEGQSAKDYVEHRTQELMKTIMPIQAIGVFHVRLVQEQKNPVYYGDIVTPEDADQVLMRWQISETEYRVIFGSLHAETVSAEVLAELEKTLPKP